MLRKMSVGLISALLPLSLMAKGSTWSHIPKVKYKKEVSRRPTAGPDNLSAEYVKLRNEYLALKTPVQLQNFLAKIDQNYESYPTDAKFFAALSVPTVVSRAIVYRSYDLAQKHQLFRAGAVTALMRTAAGIDLLEPGNHSKVLFRYMTEPVAPGDGDKHFQNEADVQTYLMTEVRPQLEKAIERVKALELGSDKIVLDLQLFSGSASFQDGINRYRSIGNPEKNLVLSGMYGNLASIYQFNAYNIDKLIDFNKEISRIFGYESLRIITRVQGMNSKDYVEVFNKPEFSKFLTLRENGTQDMRKSYAYMRESAIAAHMAWNEVKERDLDENDILRFDLIGPFRNTMDMTDSNLIAIFGAGAPETKDDGTVVINRGQIPTIRSEVTGKTVKVDLAAFFNSPPQDLKKLLPNKFVGGNRDVTIRMKNANGNNQVYKYRNYRLGMPAGWDQKQFKTLFPGLSSAQKVNEAVEVLGQSFSGGIAMMPLSFAINP